MQVYNEPELKLLLRCHVLFLAECPTLLDFNGRVLKLAPVTQADCCPQRTLRKTSRTISQSLADRGGLT